MYIYIYAYYYSVHFYTNIIIINYDNNLYINLSCVLIIQIKKYAVIAVT